MTNAWLGLGANLQEPVQQLKQALKRIQAVEGVEVLRASSFYRTPPWGEENQDDFINAVAQVETRLDALALLREMQAIELAMGRTRKGCRWGPRLIDIDLLLYGDEQLQTEELHLPHPRMHERAFVLVPMAELEPGLEVPGHGGIGSLLQQLDCSNIRIVGKPDPDDAT
jgi:2-amino-4-hydroxy-6-hydroxymethyldihydropteridine diphosphokinase